MGLEMQTRSTRNFSWISEAPFVSFHGCFACADGTNLYEGRFKNEMPSLHLRSGYLVVYRVLIFLVSPGTR